MLIGSLKNQAANGGYKNGTFTRGGNGPYWERQAWEAQVTTSESMASRVGCLARQKLTIEAAQYTRQKIERRELVDPTEQK